MRLYLNIGEKNLSPKSTPKIEEIFRLANHYGVKTKFLTKNKLGDFCASRPHQNVVLKATRLEYFDIRTLKDLEEYNKEFYASK